MIIQSNRIYLNADGLGQNADTRKNFDLPLFSRLRQSECDGPPRKKIATYKIQRLGVKLNEILDGIARAKSQNK